MSTTVVILGILIMLASCCLIVGATVATYSARLPGSRVESPGSITLSVATALLCLSGVGGAIYSSVRYGPGDALNATALLTASSLLMLLSVAALLLFLIARQHPGQGGMTQSQARYRRVRLVEVVGWSVLAISIVFTINLWIASLIFVFCVIELKLQLLVQRRRSRQMGLLSTLAVAAGQNRPIDQAIVQFAQQYAPSDPAPYLSLAAMVRAGYSLPESLMSIRGLVPRSSLPELFASAARGDLAGGLQRAAEEFERQTRFSSELHGFRLLATITIITGVIFILVAGFVVVHIVPKFKKIFEDFDTELPAATTSFLDLADAMAAVGVLAVGGLSLVLICLVFERLFGWWDSSLDWILRWFPRVDTPDILSVIGPAVRQGRPILEPLDQIAGVHRRASIRRRLLDVRSKVADGGDPWHALSRQGLLTRTEAELLRNATRLNNLPDVLEMLAATIRSRSRWRLLMSLELIRPAVVLTMAALVLWFEIALFVPILKLIAGFS